MTVISDLGIQITRLDQRLADLQAKVRAIWGANLDLGPDSQEGQFVGVFAEAAADLDQLAGQVYLQANPVGSTGVQLDRQCALNGVRRQQDEFSTAPIQVTGDGGAVVTAGALIARSDDPTILFTVDANITLVGGVGTGVGVGSATAQNPGGILAPLATLTVPKTVISGWNGVTNTADANPGSLREKDPVLRVRRLRSTAGAAQSISDAVYSAVSAVPNVTSAVVYENQTDVVNAQGLPAHSMSVIVAGGDAFTIATAIWNTRSVGATQVGAQQVTIRDAQGFAQIVKFDRPAQVTIFTTVHLTAEPGSTVRNAIIDALAAAGAAAAKIGAPVVWSTLFAPVIAVLAASPGSPTVTSIAIGTSAGPTQQANITLGTTQIAAWDNRHDNLGAILVVTP